MIFGICVCVCVCWNELMRYEKHDRTRKAKEISGRKYVQNKSNCSKHKEGIMQFDMRVEEELSERRKAAEKGCWVEDGP